MIDFEPPPHDRVAASSRVRALLRAVIAAHPDLPRTASGWLHREHRLLGTTPASATWQCEHLANVVLALLAEDRARDSATRDHAPGPGPEPLPGPDELVERPSLAG